MYRVGFPGWKLAARFGVPLLIRLQVLHDKEAGVFVVTSRDLRGLVVEMPDTVGVGKLHSEIDGCVDLLMEDLLRGPHRPRTVTAWPGEFQAA